MRLKNLTLIFIVFSFGIQAQEISKRDSDEIKLLAQRRVERGLSDLLNTLTQEDLGEAERRFVLRQNHTTHHCVF